MATQLPITAKIRAVCFPYLGIITAQMQFLKKIDHTILRRLDQEKYFKHIQYSYMLGK